MKITTGLLIIIIAFVCYELYPYTSNTGYDEVYLIPKGFRGIINIIPNQTDGQSKVFEGNKLLYNVPSNGVIKTKFDINEGWQNLPELYYVNSKNARIPLIDWNRTVPTSEQIICVDELTKNCDETPRNKNLYTGPFRQFLLCTMSEQDSFRQIADTSRIYLK